MSSLISRRAKLLGILAIASLGLLILTTLGRFYRACEAQSVVALTGPTLPNQGTDSEAIVVLAGDRGRIRAALNLFRTRQSAWLLISGAGKSTTLVDLMNKQGEAATRVQDSWDRILFESQSSSTWENALETKKLLGDRKVDRLILLTSDYHMVRAARIFRRVLPQIQTLEYPISSYFSVNDGFFSESHLNGIGHFFWEYLKLIQFLFTKY